VGLTWNIQTEEEKALLVTPNGSGVGWLLVQHEEQLGWKTIESVTLFWSSEAAIDMDRQFTSLLFRLVDFGKIETDGTIARTMSIVV
jgi:hypothetical protein